MAGHEARILDLLRRDGIVSRDALCKPLVGGISSDVFLIEDGEKRFVVKQALPCLKVEDHWPADTSRNRVEYEFLRYLGDVLPEAAPKVFAVGKDYFLMEYLGPEYENWKTLLLRADIQQRHAVQAAEILATLHRTSFGDSKLAVLFDTTSNFHQLRTDPYLLTTGRRHPDLREVFEKEAFRLDQTRECLVHGDYSPKNMLVGKGRMVLLDCEVAWYGDPAFDVAFLINHLLLKSLFHAPENTHAPGNTGFQGIVEVFLSEYHEKRGLNPASRADLDSRTARLLLMLLLARIDGKSPVEYLSDSKREFVRNFVGFELPCWRFELHEVISKWFSKLRSQVQS
jgi:aminoglycoside phosphotransferase (APT) family kinase protein